MEAIRAGMMFVAATVPAPALAQQVPPTLDELLREANPAERETIENVAKRLYPQVRPQIDALVDRIEDDEKAAIGERRFVKGWTGDVSLGASWSSGNTNEWSVSADVAIERKGPLWEHDLSVGIDVSDSDGERTKERVESRYRARRDFRNSRWFSFGSLAFDHDGLQGIDRRFTEAIGVGYQIFDRDEFKWEVSGGPALRQTRFNTGLSEDLAAAFFNTELKWEITDTLTFREKAEAVFDSSSTSFSSSTSLTSNLYGRLSGRLSFDVDVEGDAPVGSKKVDKSTHVSLVLDL